MFETERPWRLVALLWGVLAALFWGTSAVRVFGFDASLSARDLTVLLVGTGLGVVAMHVAAALQRVPGPRPRQVVAEDSAVRLLGIGVLGMAVSHALGAGGLADDLVVGLVAFGAGGQLAAVSLVRASTARVESVAH